MITAEMQNELIQLMQEGKIVEEVVSKESTIANLTTFFLRSWNMQQHFKQMKAGELWKQLRKPIYENNKIKNKLQNFIIFDM